MHKTDEVLLGFTVWARENLGDDNLWLVDFDDDGCCRLNFVRNDYNTDLELVCDDGELTLYFDGLGANLREDFTFQIPNNPDTPRQLILSLLEGIRDIGVETITSQNFNIHCGINKLDDLIHEYDCDPPLGLLERLERLSGYFNEAPYVVEAVFLRCEFLMHHKRHRLALRTVLHGLMEGRSGSQLNSLVNSCADFLRNEDLPPLDESAIEPNDKHESSTLAKLSSIAPALFSRYSKIFKLSLQGDSRWIATNLLSNETRQFERTANQNESALLCQIVLFALDAHMGALESPSNLEEDEELRVWERQGQILDVVISILDALKILEFSERRSPVLDRTPIFQIAERLKETGIPDSLENFVESLFGRAQTESLPVADEFDPSLVQFAHENKVAETMIDFSKYAALTSVPDETARNEEFFSPVNEYYQESQRAWMETFLPDNKNETSE